MAPLSFSDVDQFSDWEVGLGWVRRDVFLDNVREVAAVTRQLNRAASLARELDEAAGADRRLDQAVGRLRDLLVGGVNQDIFFTLSLEQGVHRIPSGAGLIEGEQPVLPEKLIYQRGFPGVGPADDGQGRGALLSRRLLSGLGKAAHQLVEQVGDPDPVDGADRVGITEPEPPDMPHILGDGLDVVVRIGAPPDSTLVSRTIAPCSPW